MEAPETLLIIRRWALLRFCDKETEETKEHRKSLFVPLAALGLFIIVVGIVFETYAEGKASDFEALLLTHESDKITIAEEDAASAIRDAGTARASANIAAGASKQALADAGEARNQANTLEGEVVSARQETATAVEKAAAATQKAADATIAADKERTARLQLEEDIAPRILEQFNSSEKLKPFRGLRYALKVVEGADLETRRTVGQIRIMLQMAEWKEDVSVAGLSNAPSVDEGIEVEYNPILAVLTRAIPPEDSADEAAVTLMQVLKDNKMRSTRWPRGLSITKPPLPGPMVIIHVGLKPLGEYFLQKRVNEGSRDKQGNSVLGNSQVPK